MFQAFVKMVQMEQEKAEKLRQKEEEERRRKREEKQRMKRMLEAAFDGDTDEMATILKEVLWIFLYFLDFQFCVLYRLVNQRV